MFNGSQASTADPKLEKTEEQDVGRGGERGVSLTRAGHNHVTDMCVIQFQVT